MIRVIVCGNGRMGSQLIQEIKKEHKMHLVMVVDSSNLHTLACVCEPIDLVFDFSHPSALPEIASFVSRKRCAYVNGTSGYSKEQEAVLYALAKQVPILYAMNFSIGIAVLEAMLSWLVPRLAPYFDMEIFEIHHRYKKDAPSGTALHLLEHMDPFAEYVPCFERLCQSERQEKEIGIHSIRGGSAAGEHTICFLGEEEELRITHIAHSKRIFAIGALQSAYWLLHQEPGLYSMKERMKDVGKTI